MIHRSINFIYTRDGFTPSIEEADMRESRCNSGKTETIRKSKEHAEMYLPLLLVSLHIYLKLVVHDCGDIIRRPIGCEQMRGEYREGLCTVQVEAPVCHRDDDIEENNIANENVDNSEEGTDERAEEE